jgi:mono/diheme cytochrome c family protein
MKKTVSVVLTVAAITVAATACSGGKNSSSSTTTTTTTASSPAASPVPSTAASSSAMAKAGGAMASAGGGAKVYNTNCSSCHQANGKGQPGVFPPLAGNAAVTGPADKVIHIVKNGLSGKITVGSSTYNGQMPAWKGTLSDGDIAAVVTYIRSSWGNHASAVTASQVTSTK